MLIDSQEIELTNVDIQQLSNRNAITAFFARLSYGLNYRLIQNLASTDITTDALKTTVSHFERPGQERPLF
jgi:hypothetical protein